MKKLLFIVILSAIGYVSTAQEESNTDNLQKITSICYDVETTSRIRVSDDLNISTLSTLDKLKFKRKRYIQKHKEYFDDSANAVCDITFVSHTNMYPKWYTPPEMIRSDINGTTSFFPATNKYLTDGWVGGSISKTEHGEYLTDKATGKNIYQQDYSTLGNDTYTRHNTMVSKLGYLYKYVFKQPSATSIKQFRDEGYTIVEDNNIISIKNTNNILVWDTLEKVFVNQIIEGDVIINTTKTYYNYINEYATYIISKTITTTPKFFDNGDFYETVTVTEFTNFSSRCNGKSYIETNNSQKDSNKLNVYPNPSFDLVIVSIPKTDKPSVLKLIDFSGNIIMQRKIDAGNSSFELNTTMLSNGIYTINIYQGNNDYTSKLIKK